MRRPARGLTFLAALAQQRRVPGNCSRCGRPNPEPAQKGALHGRCPACRAYQRAWKARNRKPVAQFPAVRTVIVDPRQFYAFEERVRRLETLVKDMRRFAGMRYRVGYAKGQYKERCRWRDMARPHTAWKDAVGIEAAQQMTHKMEARG